MSDHAALLVSAGATTMYALISLLSLWLLSRQIQDARRFGAAPALYALLKELEEHQTAVRRLGESDAPEATDPEPIRRYLEFFERVEHLRSAGVLPLGVLTRGFGPALRAHLRDPRFARGPAGGCRRVRGSAAARAAGRSGLSDRRGLQRACLGR